MTSQINVYKKWQGLYDELKGKYDVLMANTKEDYKGMYEEVMKQQQRLKGLYELKQADFQKLKRASSQKI